MRCKTSNFDGKYIMRVGRRGGGGEAKTEDQKRRGRTRKEDELWQRGG
jgi:hypothetical protein